MKRNWLIILLLVMLFASGALEGCSGTGKTNKSYTAVEGLEQNTKNAEQVTLTFFFKGLHAQEGTDETLKEIEKKLKDTLNIKLEFKFFQSYFNASGYNNAVKARLAAGEPCEAIFYSDCPFFDNSFIMDTSVSLRGLVKSESIMDISDLLPKYAPKLYSMFSNEQLEPAKVNGRIVAVPSLFPRTSRCCAAIRKDLLAKYNISRINGVEDYEKFLKTVKEKEPELIATRFLMDDICREERSTTIDFFYEKYGYVPVDHLSGLVYRWNDPDMKLTYYNELPEYESYKNMMKSWRKYFVKKEKGENNTTNEKMKLNYPGIENLYSDINDDFRLASFIGYPQIDNIIGYYPPYMPVSRFLLSTDGSPYKDEISFYGTVKEYEYVYFPLFPQNKVRLGSSTDAAIIIPDSAKYPERTLAFLEWIQSSQENYDLLMYGINGKHHTLYGEQYKPESNNFYGGIGQYINWPCSLPFWNLDYLRTSINTNPVNKDKYKELVKTNSSYVPHNGFYPDFETNLMELKIVSSSYWTGQEKDFNEQRATLKKEIQKQLDEWRRANKK